MRDTASAVKPFLLFSAQLTRLDQAQLLFVGNRAEKAEAARRELGAIAGESKAYASLLCDYSGGL